MGLEVVCLVAAAALSSASGGVFAGPTTPTGSSLYWGPAVLSTLPDAPAALLEATAFYFDVSYARAAEDPAREPDYPEVSFASLAPDLSITLLVPTPWSSLRLLAGGFSPVGGGTRWPDDGPQRYHATDGTIITYAGVAGLVWSPSPRFALAAAAGSLFARITLASSYDFGAFINSKLPPGAALFELEDPTLEGHLSLAVSGWSTAGVLSAMVAPLDGLELAATAILARETNLTGDIRVDGPPALADALPDVIINPRGDFEVRYPIPLIAHAEAELTRGAWAFAAMVQYVRRSQQRVLYGRVVESESGFVEGDQVSIKETRDKWTLGARVQRALDAAWVLGARLDVTPRAIPKEAISPLNLDFTLFEGNVGARWHLSEQSAVELTYGAAAVVPVVVTRSIFNPRAPPRSGLSQTSGIGRYDAWAMKLVLAFSTRFGE